MHDYMDKYTFMYIDALMNSYNMRIMSLNTLILPSQAKFKVKSMKSVIQCVEN